MAKRKGKVSQLPGTARGIEVKFPPVEEIVMQGGVSKKRLRAMGGGGGSIKDPNDPAGIGKLTGRRGFKKLK